MLGYWWGKYQLLSRRFHCLDHWLDLVVSLGRAEEWRANRPSWQMMYVETVERRVRLGNGVRDGWFDISLIA